MSAERISGVPGTALSLTLVLKGRLAAARVRGTATLGYRGDDMEKQIVRFILTEKDIDELVLYFYLFDLFLSVIVFMRCLSLLPFFDDASSFPSLTF